MTDFVLSAGTGTGLLSQLPAMAYRSDVGRERRMLEVSDGALGLTGYTPASFLGSGTTPENGAITFSSIIHPDDIDWVLQQVQHAVDGRCTVDLNYRLICADGVVKPVVEYGTTVCNAEGQVVALVGIIIDDSEREMRRAWQAHAQAAVVSVARDAAMSDGNVTMLSQVVARTCAETLAVARAGVWLLNHEKSVLRLVCLFERDSGRYSSGIELLAADYPAYFSALVSGRAIDAHDARTDSRTCEFLDVYLKPLDIRAMLDGVIRIGGDIVGVVCAEHVGTPRHWDIAEVAFTGEMADQISQVISVSERRAADRRAIEAQARSEAKSRLLATMSHEIRTPMNGVLGMAQLLEETELNAEQRNYVRLIRESGSLLLDITNDVLDYSRIEAGKLVLQQQRINVRHFLDDLLALFKAEADKKGIALDYWVDAAVPEEVFSDSNRLKQILVNLLGNALKFTNEGVVRVRVTVGESGGDMQIFFAVVDSGIGIAQDAIEQLFQPFEQVKEAQINRSGSGLGLAIARGLAEAMGGKLTVVSGVGRGSTFTLCVPLLIAGVGDQDAGGNAAVISTVSPFSDLYVYVAEDNDINQQVIRAMLRRIGIEPVICCNGEKLLEKLESEVRKVDVIFMDCEMPVLSGFETTVALRARNWRHRDTRVIALTAHALPEFRHQAESVGMNDYLTKPIKREVLQVILQQLLLDRLHAV